MSFKTPQAQCTANTQICGSVRSSALTENVTSNTLTTLTGLQTRTCLLGILGNKEERDLELWQHADKLNHGCVLSADGRA